MSSNSTGSIGSVPVYLPVLKPLAVSANATLCFERRLLLVSVAQGHLPVPRGAVERREHLGISR